MAGPENAYQAGTSESKLRGQYYTPDELVTMMLEGLDLASFQLIVDPACGDASYLRAAVAAVARRCPEGDRRALARHWVERLIGFYIDGDAVAAAARIELGCTWFRARPSGSPS